MNPTGIEKVKLLKADALILQAKADLCKLKYEAVDKRFASDIDEMVKHITEASKIIRNITHPQKDFDAKEFLNKKTDADKEYLEKVQKILEEAKTHLEENDKLGKE